MKKLNNFKFGAKFASNEVMTAARWEKIQADGKWFWIFKRGAIWATMILFFYGAGALLVPTFFNFQPGQFLILSGMFAGFLVSSISEWSKMEKSYRENEVS